jgi:hypothetical protein
LLRSRYLTGLVVLAILVLTACGGDDAKQIETASYTCADFNKSLRTKGDNTAGQFINKLRDQADLGQDKTVERREITLGIYFACRGKPGSTKPADQAIATAKRIKAGKFHPPTTTGKTKTSGQ